MGTVRKALHLLAWLSAPALFGSAVYFIFTGYAAPVILVGAAFCALWAAVWVDSQPKQ